LLRDTTRTIIAPMKAPTSLRRQHQPYADASMAAVIVTRALSRVPGFLGGLGLRDKILVKDEAPELLRRELLSPKWRPRVLGISGVTDAYQPIERRLRLTHRCLEVLASFATRCRYHQNHLVTRDCD